MAREDFIKIRVTKGERRLLERGAAGVGMSVSELLRNAALERVTIATLEQTSTKPEKDS